MILGTLFFSFQNLLALGGEDKCITVSNVDGDTIRQVKVNFTKTFDHRYNLQTEGFFGPFWTEVVFVFLSR